MAKATLSDIARRAGVGTATVERVLNGRGGVRPETTERVLAAARALDYPRRLPEVHRGLLRIEVQAMGDQGWRLQLLADEARLDPQAPQIAPARALLQAQRAALQLAQRGSTACIGIELPRGMALP